MRRQARAWEVVDRALRRKVQSSPQAGIDLAWFAVALQTQGGRRPYRYSRVQPYQTAPNHPVAAAAAGFRSVAIARGAAEMKAAAEEACSLGRAACTLASVEGSTFAGEPDIADSTCLGAGIVERSSRSPGCQRAACQPG